MLHRASTNGGGLLQSRNYAPTGRLATHIRRHYVFEAPLPPESVIEDRLISENAFVRILIRGDWAGETSPGNWVGAGPVVLFGANGKPFPVRVKGPFAVAGFAIRPSAWHCLFSEPATTFADRMVPLSVAWGEVADRLWDEIRAAPDDLAIVGAMERAIKRQLDKIGRPDADEKLARFETIARTVSTARVDEIAPALGLSVRQFERRCLAGFGLSPKAVLRRSRFLDMASAYRGFTAPGEARLAELRYFDQSHLNREVRHYTGRTPGQFARAYTPLFDAGLVLREQGKALP